MSILDAVFVPGGALLAVDTQSIGHTSGPCDLSKMFPLVHLNAVIAGRGSPLFVMAMAIECNASAMDLDGLCENLLEGAPRIFACVAKEVRAQHGVDIPKKNGVALFGFSKQRRAMRGCYISTEDGIHFVERRRNPEFIGPWWPEIEHLTKISKVRDLIPLAQAQARLIARDYPEECGGGRLIVAHLNEDSVTIAPVCELQRTPAPAQVLITSK